MKISQPFITDPQCVAQQQNSSVSLLAMTRRHQISLQQRSQIDRKNQNNKTNENLKTSDDTWGPIFKNKENFVNMHVC